MSDIVEYLGSFNSVTPENLLRRIANAIESGDLSVKSVNLNSWSSTNKGTLRLELEGVEEPA